MADELTMTGAVRLYLFRNGKSEDEVAEMSGMTFGPNGFYYGKTELNDSAARGLAQRCGIPSSVLSDRSEEGLAKKGLLDTFGNRLYYAMLRSGASKTDVGRKSGCGCRNVEKFLDGSEEPSAEQAEGLAKAAGTSAAFLNGGGDEDEEEEPFSDAAFKLVLRKRKKRRDDVRNAPKEGCYEATYSTKKRLAKELGVGIRTFDPNISLKTLSEEGLFETQRDRLSYLMDSRGLDPRGVALKAKVKESEILSVLTSSGTLSDASVSKLSSFFSVTPGFLKTGCTDERMDVFWYALFDLMRKNGMPPSAVSDGTGIGKDRLKALMDGSADPTGGEIGRLASFFGVLKREIPTAQLRPDGTFSDMCGADMPDNDMSRDSEGAANPSEDSAPDGSASDESARGSRGSGTALSKLLAMHDMTPDDLAEELGIDGNDAFLLSIGKGGSDCEAEYGEVIAKFFGVAPSDVFPRLSGTGDKDFGDVCGKDLEPSASGRRAREPEAGSDREPEQAGSGGSDDGVGAIIADVWGWTDEEWESLECGVKALIALRRHGTDPERGILERASRLSEGELDGLEDGIEEMRRLKSEC